MATDLGRIPTLDGWRAVAISAVIIHHVASIGMHESSVMFRFGMGVDIFFAISGLLITSRLLDDGSLKSFYVRRVFRILPPALCYLCVLWLLGLYQDGTEALSCLTFWRNCLPPDGRLFTSRFRSLSLEEQFYLFWPGVLLMATRQRAPKWVFAAILFLNV